MPLLLRPAPLSCSRFPSSSLLTILHFKAPSATTAFSSSTSHFYCGVTPGNVNGGHSSANRRRARRWGAVERDSEFEIDRDKAREALEKLDQQLKALSEKETAPTKRRALPSSRSFLDSDPDKNRTIGMRDEEPEFNDSYLAYSAVALLILTIVNNILFNVFVKPSVDGEELPPTAVRQSPTNVTAQQAPPLEPQ